MWTFRSLRALILFLALPQLDARPAFACGNAVELALDKATKLAMDSEQVLAAGNAKQALNLLSSLAGNLPGSRSFDEFGYGYDEDWPALIVKRDKKGDIERRITRTFAVAVLRVQPHKALDAYAIFDTYLKKSPDDPYLLARRAESAVAFKSISAKVLAAMDKEIKKSKQAVADLEVRAKSESEHGSVSSEVRFTLPEEQENLKKLSRARALAQAALREANQAQKTLETLAAADLLTDPEAYALLSKLRRLAKDSQGAQDALVRCQTMAGGAGPRCDLAGDGPKAAPRP